MIHRIRNIINRFIIAAGHGCTSLWDAVKRHPYYTGAVLAIATHAVYWLLSHGDVTMRTAAGDGILIAAAINGATFIVLYGFGARWYSSQAGWNMMVMMVCIEMLTLLNVSGRLWGADHWGRPEARIIIYSILWAAIVQRVGWVIATYRGKGYDFVHPRNQAEKPIKPTDPTHTDNSAQSR